MGEREIRYESKLETAAYINNLLSTLLFNVDVAYGSVAAKRSYEKNSYQ